MIFPRNLIVILCFYNFFTFVYCQETIVKFENEEQVVKKFILLEKEEKLEEGLAVLDLGLRQYPMSTKIGSQKLHLLMGMERYEECLNWLNEFIPKIPEEKKNSWIRTRNWPMQQLLFRELEQKEFDKALFFLREMANSRYKNIGYLNRSDRFEPLRTLSEFNHILKKIADNAGIGKPAKDFSVVLTTGETFTLSEQKGKVILIDFWSTSCPPCIKEFPNLRDIYSVSKHKGFEILSISLDGNKEKFYKFLESNPMPWKHVFTGKMWKDDVKLLYEVDAIPSLWLIDKKGILRYVNYKGKELEAAVEKLISE